MIPCHIKVLHVYFPEKQQPPNKNIESKLLKCCCLVYIEYCGLININVG